MILESKKILLKNGETAILCSPGPEDAAQMLENLKTTAAETDFMLRYPEECTMTTAQEVDFLQGIIASPNQLMILCEINGQIVGNCYLSFQPFIKTRHRGYVAMGIVKAHWNNGIGTAMFRELFDFAAKCRITQLELDVIEGNDRAMALYEKMGFRIAAEKPDAIRLKDGTMLSEFFMIKKL